MPAKMVAFKEAAWIFALSRLVMIITTVVDIFLPPQYISVLKQSLAVHKFAGALAAFSLSFPVYSVVPLSSQPRYFLVIFPVSVIFAVWAKNRYFYGVSLALSLVFLLVYITFFVDGRWVA